jgi:hypothetical protein
MSNLRTSVTTWFRRMRIHVVLRDPLLIIATGARANYWRRGTKVTSRATRSASAFGGQGSQIGVSEADLLQRETTGNAQ